LRVARFIGSPRINLLDVTADPQGQLWLGGRALPLHAAQPGPLTLAIRPEDLRLDAQGYDARVEHAEFLGDHALVHLRLGTAELILRAPADLHARPGEVMRISFDPARVLLFGTDGRRVTAHQHEPARA